MKKPIYLLCIITLTFSVTSLLLASSTPSGSKTIATNSGTIYIPSSNGAPDSNTTSQSGSSTSVSGSSTSGSASMSFIQLNNNSGTSTAKAPVSKTRKFHTNYILFKPNGTAKATTPVSQAYSPQQLYKTFNVQTDSSGVPTASAKGVIAIISAGTNSTLMQNLNVYSTQYGLPKVDSTNFYYESVPQTSSASVAPTKTENDGIKGEANLDVDMVHAMCPKAKIAVFYAYSMDDADIDAATKRAATYVHQNGGGIVSISLGDDSADFNVTKNPTYKNDAKSIVDYPDVAYIASTGDDGRFPSLPAALPNVIAAGGVSIANGTNTATPWCDIYVYTPSGVELVHDNDAAAAAVKKGGSNAFIIGVGAANCGFTLQTMPSKTTYQKDIAKTNSQLITALDTKMMSTNTATLSKSRVAPDISFEADPENGVSAYDDNGWEMIGGTSVSAPALAGMINSANVAYSTDSTKSYTEVILENIYTNFKNDSNSGNNFIPVTTGAIYLYQAHDSNQKDSQGNEVYYYTYQNYYRTAMSGYNAATGTGAPYGYQGFQAS